MRGIRYPTMKRTPAETLKPSNADQRSLATKLAVLKLEEEAEF